MVIERDSGKKDGRYPASPGRSGGPSDPSPSVSAVPAPATNAWPDELTPDLADILGRQCFMFIKLSQLYRAAGHDIPKRAESEQAFFLHRFLVLWFKHGEGWADAADAEIREVAAKARSVAKVQPAGDAS